jgi:hypothetical protein
MWLIQGLFSDGLPSHLNLPGVGDGCEHVFPGQPRVVGQDFLYRVTRGKLLKEDLDRDPGTPDDRSMCSKRLSGMKAPEAVVTGRYAPGN